MVGRVLGCCLVFRKVSQADRKSSSHSHLLEESHILQASPECSVTGQEHPMGPVASMQVQWWVTGAIAGCQAIYAPVAGAPRGTFTWPSS